MTRCRWRLIVAVGLSIIAQGCGHEIDDESTVGTSDALEVEIVSVERTQIESSLEVVGTLFPWRFATIASEVTGVITRIPDSGEEIEYILAGTAHAKVLPLDIGHLVKKDDILVEIDSTEPQLSLKVAQARMTFAEKELVHLKAWRRSEEVAQLKAQIEESDAILEDAREDLKRAEKLLSKQAISTAGFGDDVRAVAIARAGKKRAEEALKLAEAGPTAEQIAVAEAQMAMAQAEVALKQDALDKCTVHCPLDKAWIVERYAGVGDHVTANPSTPIMRIIDSSILLAQVGVPERYQGLIKPNDGAWVRADGVDTPESVDGYVPGKVVLVNAQIDPDTRTFRVRVAINNSNRLFVAGAFVKVKLSIDAVTDVVVPTESLTFANGEPAVFVVQDGKVARRGVSLGISDHTRHQVISGLKENERVVKGGLSLLASGLAVRQKSAVGD